MITEMKGVILTISAILFIGCDAIYDRVCTLEARPAIVLRVVDMQTGIKPVAVRILFIAHEGAYRDTVVYEANNPTFIAATDTFIVGLAEEREGTYEVEVSASGYQVWRKGGIRVKSDECHVKTEVIEVALESTEP